MTALGYKYCLCAERVKNGVVLLRLCRFAVGIRGFEVMKAIVELTLTLDIELQGPSSQQEWSPAEKKWGFPKLSLQTP
jgi:hypothetical protein